MSAEGDASQPAPGASEKPQAPNAAPSFVSTFINKNTGGKKFAPKAARRRPGASITSATQRPSPAPSTRAPEPQASQVEPSNAAADDAQATSQDVLPTPAATQDNATPEVLRASGAHAEPRPPEARPETAASFATPDATPALPLPVGAASQVEESISTAGLAPSRPAEEELDSGHPHKRQRIENVQNLDGPASVVEPETPVAPEHTSTIVDTAPSDTHATIEPAPEEPQGDVRRTITEQLRTHSAASTLVDTTASANQDVRDDSSILEAPAQAQPRRGNRRLPWVSVNQPTNDGDETAETTASTQTPARTRRRRNIPTADEAGDREAVGDDAELQAPGGRTTRGRGRRNAADDTGKEWEPEALPRPPTKPRKPRKDKGTRKKKIRGVPNEGGPGDDEAVAATEGGQRTRNKNAPKRKKVTAQAENGEEQAENLVETQTPRALPKRRQREATPPDAENQVIDTANTFMHGLASRRGPRTGQISERELRMRSIDWDAVRQRQREENAIGVEPIGSRRAVDEALARAGEAHAEAVAGQSRLPQFRTVNGQIVLAEEAVVIDREADADREIEQMEEIEEDDLTNRVTVASYLKADKRFPKEFLLPGQGKKWGNEATEAFYDALQMFGTDFMMISTLFPGTTRRSIKTKFNREERENPRRIKAALNGQRNSNWSEYLNRSGMEEDAFLDPTVIEKELQEQREQMRVDIEAARLAKAEEDRQKVLAGVTRDGMDGEKENEDERRKRKRKDRVKAVSFEPEEGVEILPLNDD